MDAFTAFIIGEMNRNKEMKIFDWDLAAQIIKKHKIKNATAGLKLDLEWTLDTILLGGKPRNGRGCYLGSTWAIPILVNADTGNEYECYHMKSETPYDKNTMWPASALGALGFAENDIEREMEDE